MEITMEQFLISFIYTTVSLAILMPIFIIAERKIIKKLLRVLEEKIPSFQKRFKMPMKCLRN